MFPRLKQQLLARADLLVELSTLGEYGIDERGAMMPLEHTAVLPRPASRQRGCRTERLASATCATGSDPSLPARP